MKKNKYPWHIVLWGAGEMTRRVLQHIDMANVSAIIDNDEKKIGGIYLDKPIISLSEYQKKYAHEFILVTPMYWREIVQTLQERGISSYFLLADCPSEFSEIAARSILYNCMSREILKDSKFCIFGSTIYALMLNEWAKEHLGRYVPVILPDGIDESFKYNLKKSFDKMNFYDESYLEYVDKAMVADGWELERLVQRWPEINFVNAYDIADREELYYSPRMASMRDRHKGEACFIIGLGPSLRIEDLNMLEQCGITTFSMNSITEAFDRTEWRPTYYAMTDPRECSDEFLAQLENIPKRCAFISDKVESVRKSSGTDKTVPFHVFCNMSSKGGVVFSEEPARYIGYGATVTYCCLQIAAYMGFNKIYLLGLDGYDPKAKNHGYGHFYDETEVVSFAYTDQVYRGYNAARAYGEKHGIQILNATRGGYIEIFNRVDFDSLFTQERFTPERAIIKER